MKTEKIKYPLKNKLIVLVLVAMVPVLYVAIYLILALVNYSRAYDQIVNSMLLANAYNINFKEEMDESLYKLVVSNVTSRRTGHSRTLTSSLVRCAQRATTSLV